MYIVHSPAGAQALCDYARKYTHTVTTAYVNATAMVKCRLVAIDFLYFSYFLYHLCNISPITEEVKNNTWVK